MQASGVVIEREARHRLPCLLANLLEDPDVTVQAPSDDFAVDLVASDRHGRQWLIEVKASSRPGQVARALERRPPMACG